MTSKAEVCSIGADLSAQDIVTARLELIAVTPEMLRADFAKSPQFGELLDAAVPPNWPSDGWDEAAYNYLLDKMAMYPNLHGWSRYISIKGGNGNRRILAGGCGLMQPVELTSDPEIGYGLLSQFHHFGYASEAVSGLVEWIFARAHVRSVNAQTFPDHHASLRVLAKQGFKFAGPGPGPEEGTVLYRKWR